MPSLRLALSCGACRILYYISPTSGSFYWLCPFMGLHQLKPYFPFLLKNCSVQGKNAKVALQCWVFGQQFKDVHQRQHDLTWRDTKACLSPLLFFFIKVSLASLKISFMLFRALNQGPDLEICSFFRFLWHCWHKCSVGVSINFVGETSVFLKHSLEATPRVQRFRLWSFWCTTRSTQHCSCVLFQAA